MEKFYIFYAFIYAVGVGIQLVSPSVFDGVITPDLLNFPANIHGAGSLVYRDRIEGRIESPECELYRRPKFSQRLHGSVLRPNSLAQQQYKLASRLVDTMGGLMQNGKHDKSNFNNVFPSDSHTNDQCPTYMELTNNDNRCIRYAGIRPVDGRCNNLYNPIWGASMSAHRRLVPNTNLYEDGIQAPRMRSIVDGSPLPNPRIVSTTVSRSQSSNHTSFTTMGVFFGQFLDHDFALSPIPFVNTSRGIEEPPVCCHVPLHCRHPDCLEFPLPPHDVFYSKFGETCHEFLRAMPALRPFCKPGVREQMNELTSYIDLSNVYGWDDERLRHVRAYVGGLLRPNMNELIYNNRMLLPEDEETFDCSGISSRLKCFLAGDVRASENPHLTVWHTIWFREHNRIANYMNYYAKQQGWYWVTDEVIFQTARKINIALYQNIVYSEWLNIMLGDKFVSTHEKYLDLRPCRVDGSEYRPTCSKLGYYLGYDPKEEGQTINEFVSAVFRLGHTLLPDAIFRYNPKRGRTEGISLSQRFFFPFDLYNSKAIEQVAAGMTVSSAESFDNTINPSVQNHLFQDIKEGDEFGMDLFSLNIQRSRDVGLLTYNMVRKVCGLRRAKSFEDLRDVMDWSAIERLRQTYKHVDDIELFPGGISERPVNGGDGIIGTTFSCVVALQFSILRRADRFWYENPHMFTPEQLLDIKKERAANVVCRNMDVNFVKTYAVFDRRRAAGIGDPCKVNLNLRLFVDQLKTTQKALQIGSHGYQADALTH